MTRHRFRKAAKTTAYWVAKEALGRDKFEHGGEIRVRIIAQPIAGKPRPDADNLIASCKSLIDGIALAIGVDDKHFTAPSVEWAGASKRGSLTIELTGEVAV